MSALALGIGCPSLGTTSNARMQTDLQSMWNDLPTESAAKRQRRKKHNFYDRKPEIVILSFKIVIHRWYFWQENRQASFFIISHNQHITAIYASNDDTMILFEENIYVCENELLKRHPTTFQHKTYGCLAQNSQPLDQQCMPRSQLWRYCKTVGHHRPNSKELPFYPSKAILRKI